MQFDPCRRNSCVTPTPYDAAQHQPDFLYDDLNMWFMSAYDRRSRPSCVIRRLGRTIDRSEPACRRKIRNTRPSTS